MTKQHLETLKKLGAWKGDIEWAQQFDTAQEAWDACEQGEWMVWLAAHFCERRVVVSTTCECIRHTLCMLPNSRFRLTRVLELAEAWSWGTLDSGWAHFATFDSNATAEVGHAALADNTNDVAKHVHDAVICAVREVAADEADSARAPYAYSAPDAAVDAGEAAAEAAVERLLRECAQIVRRRIPRAPLPTSSEKEQP